MTPARFLYVSINELFSVMFCSPPSGLSRFSLDSSVGADAVPEMALRRAVPDHASSPPWSVARSTSVAHSNSSGDSTGNGNLTGLPERYLATVRAVLAIQHSESRDKKTNPMRNGS